MKCQVLASTVPAGVIKKENTTKMYTDRKNRASGCNYTKVLLLPEVQTEDH